METLMLEVETRGLHRYFELNRTVTRIGRALDNDIILSDPTVAPYHLKITVTDSAGINIENLAEVNPTRINGRQQAQIETTTLPVDLQLGRIKASLLSPDQDVANARPLASLKWGALFSFVLRETALTIGLFILGLTVVERLLVNRWEVKLVTLSVCMAYIVYTISSLLTYQISYLLSSQWPTPAR